MTPKCHFHPWINFGFNPEMTPKCHVHPWINFRFNTEFGLKPWFKTSILTTDKRSGLLMLFLSWQKQRHWLPLQSRQLHRATLVSMPLIRGRYSFLFCKGPILNAIRGHSDPKNICQIAENRI